MAGKKLRLRRKPGKYLDTEHFSPGRCMYHGNL